MNLGSLSKFQLIFMSALVVVIIGAIAAFALTKSSSGSVTNVTIWGTLPDAAMQTFLQRPDITAALSAKKVSVKYVVKQETTFDQDVVNAIASGAGPDAVIISQDQMLQYFNKIVPIPFSSLSQADFQKTYVQEANLFLTSQGAAALPFTIDPMVMYWNRTSLTSAGIAKPPQTWSELYGSDGIISKINVIDVNHNIIKSAVALGTFGNIYHAKDLLSLIMMQAGTPIVSKTSTGNLQSALTTVASGVPSSCTQAGGQAGLSFYTQFADPIKDLYSWNSALPLSRDAFTAGDLALYFGYASELSNIYARNPNLNFDVALMPKSLSSDCNVNFANMTFGKVYGISILKSSPNFQAAANAMIVLTDSASQAVWSDVSGFPPITVDLLAKLPSDPFKAIFYTAALQSQAWLDPNRTATDQIFSDMVGSVLSGNETSSQAVQDASSRLDTLLNSTN